MSMETTCIKCRTVFRVTTEQLNAHQGDVRCGVCGTLFNAFDSLAPARTQAEEKHDPLQSIEAGFPASVPLNEPPPVAEPAIQVEMLVPEVTPEVAVPTGIAPPQPEPETEEEPFADFDAVLGSGPVASAEAPVEESEALPELVVSEESFADFASAIEAVQAVPAAEPEKATEVPGQESSSPAIPLAEPAVTEPSFSPKKSNAIKAELDAIEGIYAEFAKKMDLTPLPSATQMAEEGQARAFLDGGAEELAAASAPLPQQTNTATVESLEPSLDDDLLEPFNTAPEKRLGWLWGIAALPLLVLLAGQFAYFYRVDLAARYPASRPILEQACAQIHCSVPLPRNADLLKIESSDLEADTEFPSRVTLASAVSNRAAYRQAYPQLELTLTNHEDQPLARRIFTPAEYLATSVDAKQGMAANSETVIRLNLDLGELNAVGYRLYVFYTRQR